MKAGRGLTVERMAQLGHISRASFYRFDENGAPGHNADMELRDAIQRIALHGPAMDARESPLSCGGVAGR